MAARESEMRMPRTQVRKQPDRERGFLDPFVKLKKMRMTGADSNPDYVYRALGWKCSEALDGQEESMELDRFEFFA